MEDMFAESQRNEKTLLNELAACPISEITGLIDSTGAGGSKIGREKLWSLSFSFTAWRIGSGDLRKSRLTVRRKVTDEEFNELQPFFDSETLVCIQARVAEENSFDCPQALLEKFVREVSDDAELNQLRAKLQQPVTLEDAQFGTFTLDRRIQWFSAVTKWCGREITLNLEGAETGEVDKALSVAKELWSAAKTWQTRVQDFAVEQLLELKNGNWSEEDEHEVTDAEFKRRMTLETITVNPDGSFDFWHDDGDLFFGHSIQVSGSLAEGLTDADIPG